MSHTDHSIQRCPHDEENPYAQISRELIRDDTISPNCRWLLMLLLSNKDGWVIKIPQLVRQCKNHFGRDKVYQLIKEAVVAGYMFRHEYLEKGKKRYTYYLSEKPKFKKCLLFPGFQYTENTYSKEEEYVSILSSTASPSLTRSEPLPLDPSDSEPPSPEALKLAELFSSSLKEFNPQALIDERETVEAFSSMQKENPAIEFEESCAAIKFLFESKDDFWRKKGTAAKDFKKNFKGILKQSRDYEASEAYEDRKKENKLMAKKIAKHFKDQSKNNLILDEGQAFARKIIARFEIEKDGVLDKKSGKKVKFSLPKDQFLRNLNDIFDIFE